MDGQNYQNNQANVPYQAPGAQPQPNKANALQIISLICGIAGIVMGCCIPFVGIVLGIIGLICAIVGNKQGKTGVGTGGLVCSIIALVLGLIILVLGLIMGVALIPMLDELSSYSSYY